MYVFDAPSFHIAGGVNRFSSTTMLNMKQHLICGTAIVTVTQARAQDMYGQLKDVCISLSSIAVAGLMTCADLKTSLKDQLSSDQVCRM